MVSAKLFAVVVVEYDIDYFQLEETEDSPKYLVLVAKTVGMAPYSRPMYSADRQN